MLTRQMLVDVLASVVTEFQGFLKEIVQEPVCGHDLHGPIPARCLGTKRLLEELPRLAPVLPDRGQSRTPAKADARSLGKEMIRVA